MYGFVKRCMDLVLGGVALLVLGIPLAVLGLLIRLTSQGPALHWSRRIGINNREFCMAKFRTMRIDTPQVATHLMTDPTRYVTPMGKFLRRYSLDELPQLLNILKGDLSIVGPRPALYNQDDLIALRTEKGVHRVKPGLTGWAQIHGRDEIPIPRKVIYDEWYCMHRSFLLDIRIILLTFAQVLTGKDVSH